MTETGVEEQVPVTEETASTQPQTEKENKSSKVTPMTSGELKELKSILTEVRSTFKNMEAMTKSCFSSAGVDFAVMDVIQLLITNNKDAKDGTMRFPIEDAPDGKTAAIYITDDDVRQVLGDAYVENDNEKNVKLFDDIYQVAAQYISIRDALIDIQNEYREEIQKQYNYMTSPEFAKEMDDRLKAMEKKYEEETDESTKAELGKAIASIKSMNSMDYIFKRLSGEDAKKEVESITKNFFETRGSQYVMERYEKKAQKIGLGGNLYLNCMGIETKFLEEEYHPFNNLFLFSMLRLIAFIDVYNKDEVMYAKNTMRMMLRLMNHAFPTPEAEKAFLDVIRSYLAHFMPLRDQFVKENSSYHKYIESINTPESACLPYDRTHSEIYDSNWITNVLDEENNLHVITELKSSDGIKLFANGYPIIKPSEVPENVRTRLAVLSDNNECVSIPVDVTVVVSAINYAKHNSTDTVRVPNKPSPNATLVGVINTRGLNTSRENFSWNNSTRDNVNVYVENDYVWIDDYLVINAQPKKLRGVSQHNHTEVWLADNTSIIWTNIAMSAIDALIAPATDNKEEN